MTTAQSTSPPVTTARRGGTIALWALQAALAFSFAGGGLLKLSGDPQMVDMFSQIGAGQWFRYLVGALELAGAAGLLIPRLAGVAALGIAGLMVGATFTNLVILDASPAMTLGFLLLAGLVAWVRRAQLSGPAASSRPARRRDPYLDQLQGARIILEGPLSVVEPTDVTHRRYP